MSFSAILKNQAFSSYQNLVPYFSNTIQYFLWHCLLMVFLLGLLLNIFGPRWKNFFFQFFGARWSPLFDVFVTCQRVTKIARVRRNICWCHPRDLISHLQRPLLHFTRTVMINLWIVGNLVDLTFLKVENLETFLKMLYLKV